MKRNTEKTYEVRTLRYEKDPSGSANVTPPPGGGWDMGEVDSREKEVVVTWTRQNRLNEG